MLVMHKNMYEGNDTPIHSKAGELREKVVKYKIDRCEATGHVSVQALDDHDHLCSTCQKIFPECKANIIGFGNGIGYDNIIECNEHSALSADGNPSIQKGGD